MSTTCVIHHGEVDESDVVVLPNGPVCTRCYAWMEEMMDGDGEADEYTLVFGDDEDDEDDE